MTKFLLGLGAQKAGTTWLHDYLCTLDGVDMGFMKEYTIFKPMYGTDESSRHDAIVAKANMHLKGSQVNFRRKKSFWTYISMLADTENYFNYFCGLLSRPEVVMTGDITPVYSMLGAADLKLIRKGFESRGVDCKAIFLMRDPVERVWSGARMRRRENPKISQKSEDQMVLGAMKKPGFAGRTRYEETLAAMEATFAPEDCLTSFYETLFQESEIRRICTFLGLEYRAPEFDKRVNVSQKSAPLSEDTCRKVAQHFAPTYQAVAQRFGHETVCELWPHARFVL